MKLLDKKLKKIRSSSYKPKDFIIADAKDADMGGGVRATGYFRDNNNRLTKKTETFTNYLRKIEQMSKSKLVDIVLMSMTSAERLVDKSIFKKSLVTPAVRLNDTSCIWGLIRHGEYGMKKSVPFATTQLNFAKKYVNLGLYSLTFNKDAEKDVEMLNQYRNFRYEAEKIGMRHFLEVFNSAIINLPIKEMGEYVNDCILKTLAGQISKEKPIFLKIQYNGPKAMDELASYDPGNLIIGILGGRKGTTRDTFELLIQAHKYGARVALFGKKINLSENQIILVQTMRKILEENINSLDAVKLYHDKLIKNKINPDNNINDDTILTDPSLKM